MPLFLHFVDSITPSLSDILSPLIERHIDFKLRDSFRIITPDTESSSDLEEEILRDKRLEGVLIGRSVLTLTNFWQNLLMENPNIKPLAHPLLERKALNLAFQKTNPKSRLEIYTQRQYLHELKRLYRLHLLGQGRETKQPVHPLFESYQEILTKRLGYWSVEKAKKEVWRYLAAGNCSDLNRVEEIYFLGFDYPDGELLRCIESLLQGYPKLDLLLFLPPPERLLDSNEFLSPLLEKLESLGKKSFFTKTTSLPPIKVHSYLTPLHESNILAEHLRFCDPTHFIYSPQDSPTILFLRKLLPDLFSDVSPLSSPVKNPSVEPIKLLREALSSAAGNKPVYFSDILEELNPLFQSFRERLSQLGNLTALKHLEQSRALLNDWFQAESTYAESRLRKEWLKELEEEFLELRIPPSTHNDRRFPIRNLEQGGLSQRDILFIPSLNEGIYPKSTMNFLLWDSAYDLFYYFEKKLALQQRLHLAKKEIHLSYFEFSMSGRSSSPSPFLGEFDPRQIVHHDKSLLPIRISGHPYFKENIVRENRRIQEDSTSLDKGDLTSLKLKEKLLKKINQRPVSASYIDDYARCPWSFFARWHLKLEKITEEELEIEPKFRGSLLHKLLEKIYSAFHEEYFSKYSVPPLESLLERLSFSLEELWSWIAEQPEAKFLPKKVLADEIERIKKQLKLFLEKEWNGWQEAEEKIFPQFLEWKFGRWGGPKVTFPIEAETSVPISGIIDRIDVSRDKKEFIVIDYKSSSSEALSKALREKKGFQLFIYLYAVKKGLLNQALPVGALYWDLKSLKRNQGIALKNEISGFLPEKLKSNSFMKEEEFEKLNSELKEALSELLTGVVEGDYSLNPPDCQGWRCPFNEICRYDNQP